MKEYGRSPAGLAGAGGRVLGSHWTPNKQAFPPLGGGGALPDGTEDVLGSGPQW